MFANYGESEKESSEQRLQSFPAILFMQVTTSGRPASGTKGKKEEKPAEEHVATCPLYSCKKMGHTWEQLQRLVQYQDCRRDLVRSLYP